MLAGSRAARPAGPEMHDAQRQAPEALRVPDHAALDCFGFVPGRRAAGRGVDHKRQAADGKISPGNTGGRSCRGRRRRGARQQARQASAEAVFDRWHVGFQRRDQIAARGQCVRPARSWNEKQARKSCHGRNLVPAVPK